MKAEKQLLTWITELTDKSTQQTEKIILKQETLELPIETETISTDAQSYILQQQQLPYQNIEFIEQSEYDGAQSEVRIFWKIEGYYF